MDNCDYCSGDISYLEEFESTDGKIRYLDIVFLPKIRHMQVRIIDNMNTFMNFGIETRFNYCPYCGRKLI